MTRQTRVRTRQMTLSLAAPDRHQPIEETREALLDALADLLLEALGEEVDHHDCEPGGADESEDHA